MEHAIVSGSADVRTLIETGRHELPFRTELSLEPLIRFWNDAFGDDGSAKAKVARVIREAIERAPELGRPITDVTVLDRHAELLDVMMAAVFPPAFFQQEYGAALLPLRFRVFYATPPFRRMLMSGDGHLKGSVNLDPAALTTKRLLSVYKLILERLYKVELGLEYPLVFTTTDPDTGLDRHFKPLFDHRFLDVEPNGPLPPLPDELRQRFGRELLDPAMLLEALPPDRFLFRGFLIFRAFEVTDQEVLSSIKRDLIEKESLVSAARFHALQSKLRTLFRRPDLSFGLAALEGDQVLLLNSTARLEHACIFADSSHHKKSEFAGSVFERAVTEERAVVVPDLAALPGRTRVEDTIMAAGARSMIVAPLHYQHEVIGTLEVGSSRPDDLDATQLPKLEEVLPLFSMAVRRSLEELDNRIEAVIKEKCTAIHPAVEWRFRKAVLNAIERHRGCAADGSPELEPIVFDSVYPLYALADIRGSSVQRAVAVQADLLAQLALAREVIQAAHRARPLPVLDELHYRLDKHAARVQDSLSTGDDTAVVAFLRTNVEGLFAHLQSFGPAVVACIEAYRAALDPRLGVVYAQRRQFEESVARVTESISAYLDGQEQAAQEMFPHYFEKQKTDGVDYQVYVGASLQEDGRWDPLYLKNLRLWQLMVTCGIAARADQMRELLPVPIEMTHLILVQHAPLAIRFRFDEKRFDVDGAYDIRYEIVKKRIDKALVRGSKERVTQPGRIAIVYGQPSEAQEYRRYIDYLRTLGYLTGGVEELELEELQGVHGLRALRVTVDLHNPRVERSVTLADLEPAHGDRGTARA